MKPGFCPKIWGHPNSQDIKEKIDTKSDEGGCFRDGNGQQQKLSLYHTRAHMKKIQTTYSNWLSLSKQSGNHTQKQR